jgi:hypothetical protein
MRKRKICKQVTFSSAWGKEMSESISSCLFLSYFSQSVSSLAVWLIHTTQHWSYILFLEVLGLELRASHLLGRHSTAWPTPPALELTKLEKWYEGSRGSYVAASNMLEVELQYSARVQKWSTTNFCVVSVSVIWIIFFIAVYFVLLLDWLLSLPYEKQFVAVFAVATLFLNLSSVGWVSFYP